MRDTKCLVLAVPDRRRAPSLTQILEYGCDRRDAFPCLGSVGNGTTQDTIRVRREGPVVVYVWVWATGNSERENTALHLGIGVASNNVVKRLAPQNKLIKFPKVCGICAVPFC